MEYPPEIKHQNIESRLGELLLALAIPGKVIYIDIYPVDPQNPHEYTYDYSETDIRTVQ
jgi:hypothetical protein